MIDIHSHILPGLDDGSQSLEMSVEMVRMAWAAGTTDIVATPHADFEYRYHPALVLKLIDEVSRASACPIRIHRGCDFHLHTDNLRDALLHRDRYSVNGLSYLLVELDDELIHTDIDEYFTQLQDAGFRLVITHPERNSRLRIQSELVTAWAARGILMQITAQSLTGRFGPEVVRFSQQLLDRGLVHFVASDAHDTRDRTPVLTEARAWIDMNYSPELSHLLFELFPQAVIQGRRIDLRGFPPARKSFWSRLFSKG